jgi:hypothetical protein
VLRPQHHRLPLPRLPRRGPRPRHLHRWVDAARDSQPPLSLVILSPFFKKYT